MSTKCISPFIVNSNLPLDEQIPVPCGKCPPCLARRVSGWSFRLMEEEKRAVSAQFLTLTYGNNRAQRSKNNFLELSKRDVQLFFKRLRKAHTDKYRRNSLHTTKSIKYYAVGEYGSTTMRPHYHVILFNADIELIQDAWANGQVHYGQVSCASVGYALKYMCKPKLIPMHRNDDRQPEFSLMSKGIGADYLTPAMVRWHKADLENRMYCNVEGNKKIPMPRYYKNRIYDENERIQIGNVQRLLNALAMDEYFRNTTEHERSEAHLAQFAKMYRRAKEGRLNVMVN